MKGKKQSLALAMLTSFSVTVLGAVVWGILFYYNWFSAWVAFVAVACAALCWQRFYKVNWAMFVWTAVWSIVLNIVSMLLALLVGLQIELNCSFQLAAQLFSSVFSESQRDIIIDCVLSIFFTGLGVLVAFLNFRYAKKKSAQNVAAQAYAQTSTQSEQSPTEKIANFFVLKFVKFGEIENTEERKAKLDEFRAQYIAKLDAATKAEILKVLSTKTYSQSESIAAELLKEELK